MDESVAREPRRAARLLLLAAGAGLLWAGVTMFTATPAHADDDNDGLLGLVGQVTDSASGLVSATTGAVAEVLPPVAPVTTAVSQTVSGTTDAVTQVVQQVPAVVPEVAPVVEPIVTEVVQPVVTHVVQPVVDGVAAVVEPVPVIGDVVGGIDLVETVGSVPGVVEAVDDVVGATLGGSTTGPGASSPAPLPGTAPMPLPGAESAHLDTIDAIAGAAASVGSAGLATERTTTRAALFTTDAGWSGATGTASASATPPGLADPAGSLPRTSPYGDGEPAAPSSSGASSGPLGAGPGWLDAPLWSLSGGELCAPAAGDDDLPSAPVFDTDVSPD